MCLSVLPAGGLRVTASAATQNGYAAGDIISFGLYPQTKVTNAGLITALNGCTLSADNTVLYGGDKYQRVYFTQYSPRYLTFDPTAENSYQDDNGYFINTVYWFKFEPVGWRVLSNTDGVLMIMADKILDTAFYDETLASVTWETSALRAWLNSDFYGKVFTINEKTKVLPSTIVNENNPWSGAAGGNVTADRLFLLSYADTINTSYGFNSVYDTVDASRQVKGTDYSKSRGLFVASTTYAGNSRWWLRSPGWNSVNAGYVSQSGNSSSYAQVINADIGIRPVCRIRLTPSAYAAGEIVEFGSYPQSAVTNSTLITALNSCALSADNTVIYKGAKYKKVLFSQYYSITGGYTDNTAYTFQDNNGYYKNTVYWFLCEPVKWKVLASNNGSLFAMAVNIVDSKMYYQTHTAVTWETSSIRSWLNNEFFNAAFCEEERCLVKTSQTANANNPTYGVPGGSATADKLFCLSFAEASDAAYQFSANSTQDPDREAKGTDYSKCNGLFVNDGTPFYGNSEWWLRSPGSESANAGNVLVGGLYSYDGTGVNQACIGVRPAIRINLQSAAFIPTANSACKVDTENKLIYGLTTGLNSLDGYVESINGFLLSYTGTIGTGTRVNVSTGGWVTDSYKTLIFGDVNGDGNIDSSDAGIIVDYENFLITWDPVMDAVFLKAGDVNGDGNVDSSDAGIVVDHENFILTISQTGP